MKVRYDNNDDDDNGIKFSVKSNESFPDKDIFPVAVLVVHHST